LHEAAPFSGVQQVFASEQACPEPHAHSPPQPSLPAPQRFPSQLGQQPPGQPVPMHTPAPLQVVSAGQLVISLQRRHPPTEVQR